MTSLSHLHAPRKKSKENSTGAKIQKNNYKLVITILSGLGFIILFQAFRWQILESDKFVLIAKQQYTDSGKQTAQRGQILAQDGTILAVDQPIWNIYASLSNDERERKLFFEYKDLFISTVSSILAVENKSIEEKITDDFVYVPISRDRGQNQRVHYFDNLGLTLWVWREKIRTILIYNYKDE